MAAAVTLLLVVAIVLLHFSGRANLIGLGLAGVIAVAVIFQWPFLGALYSSFSLFGGIAGFLPGTDTIIVLLTLSAFVGRKLLSADPVWRFPAAARWAILLIAWSTATVAWAVSTEKAMDILVLYLKSFLLFLVILEAAQSYGRIVLLTLAALLGVLVSVSVAAYGGLQFFFGGAAAELSHHVAVETTRLFGVWFDPNYFALALLTLIGLSLAIWRTRLTFGARCLAVLGFSALLIGIVLTLSRGGLLSAVLALVFCVWAERRRLRLLVFVGLVVMLVLIFVPIGLGERMGTFLTPGVDPSFQTRGLQLRGGIEMAIAAFPFGVGVGNYLYHSLTYVKMSHQVMSHNSYVDLAAEGGVLALFFFGGLVVSLFLATRARNSRWEVTALADNLAIGLRISLIAFLLGATFLSAEVFAPFWWLAGLIAAKALCDRELAEHDQNALAPVR